MSDLTDLAAAVHEALTPPVPPHDDTTGWRLYDRLVVNRACHVRGVLGALAGGDDSKAVVASTIRVIATAAEVLPVNYRTRDEVEPEPDRTPLVAYKDAVVDALMAAGVGVRDNEADEAGPLIGIDLDPVSSTQQPVLAWTPSAGWRVAVSVNGEVDAGTIRYVGQESVPPPAHVAGLVGVWRDNPGRLRRDEPAFGAMPRRALAERLAQRAGSGS